MSNTVKPLLYGLIGGATALAGSLLYTKITKKTAKQGSDKAGFSDDVDEPDFNIFDTQQSDFDPEDAADFFTESRNHQSNPDIDMNALQQIRNDAFNSGYNAGLHVANNREYNRGYDEGVRYGYSVAQANAAKDIDDAYVEGKLDGLNINAPDLSGVESDPPVEIDEVIKSGALNQVYKPDEKESQSEESDDIQHAIAAAVVAKVKTDGEAPVFTDSVSCAIRAMLYKMELPKKNKKHGVDQTAKALSAVHDKLTELGCDYEAIKQYLNEKPEDYNEEFSEKSLKELKQLELASANLREQVFTLTRALIEDYLAGRV